MSDIQSEKLDKLETPKGISTKNQLVVGLIMMACGAVAVGGQMGWVWYCVANHATEVTIIKKVLGGGFFAFFMGLLCICGGNRALSVFDKMDQGLSQVKWYEWLILVGLGAATYVCYSGVLQYLETFGYKSVS